MDKQGRTVARDRMHAVLLTDDELKLLEDYRDCTPKAKENVTEYAEFLAVKSGRNRSRFKTV